MVPGGIPQVAVGSLGVAPAGEHHPPLCRERKSGLVVHSQLRPGDPGSATGAVAFLRQGVARLPHRRRRPVLIRADRGFAVEALSARCERRGWP